jgi:hypothetical protein
MSDCDGSETGWFNTADEARASVEMALANAIAEYPPSAIDIIELFSEVRR